MTATVARLHMTPLKATRLHEVDQLLLEEHGAHNDRRFVVMDERGHLVNGKHLGKLMQLVATVDDDATTLSIRFPDGAEVTGAVSLGDETSLIAYGHPRAVRPLLGPWSQALSLWSGRELRVVQPVDPSDGIDRQREAGVTLLAEASVQWLGDNGGVGSIDTRRFRMTVGIAGVEAFTEERWLGHRMRVGEATILLTGNVGRCAVTTEDPESGVPNLDTLKLLARLRGEVPTTEPLPLGVWGEVVVPGRVRVGDAVVADA